MTKEQLFKVIIKYFEREMPVAETELHYNSPYELLVAVILSAQCTDKRVNMITPVFFERYPTAELLAESNAEEIYMLIKSCTYPNNKAKNLLGMAQTLIEKFKGIVPDDVDKLQEMPGVGRKTANVIASVVYQKPTMAVDTHVHRVAARIGLTQNAKTPLETEKQLVKYFPEELIPKAHHWLILHGRYVCKARQPLCENCGLKEVCIYYNKTLKNNTKNKKL
jgi:endonuclease III